MNALRESFSSKILVCVTFFLLKVSSNPYHYQSHVELIKLIRDYGDLDKLRDARENMSKIFPLTEGKYSNINNLNNDKKQAEKC